jgi:hypothetical protein
VAHGLFLHEFTENWTKDDPSKSSDYENCEVRQFKFTAESNETEPHLVETEESYRARKGYVPEKGSEILTKVEVVEVVEAK